MMTPLIVQPHPERAEADLLANDGMVVACVLPTQEAGAADNAAWLARCANSHDALVATLIAAREHIRMLAAGKTVASGLALATIDAALELAGAKL